MRTLELYAEDWGPGEGWAGDRRQSERRPIRFDVMQGVAGRSYRGRARDVSPTGIQVEADRELEVPIESIIPMLLYLPGRSRPLRTSATVIWTHGSRAGFEFVAMSDADRLEIAEMVDRVEQSRVTRASSLQPGPAK